MKSNNSIYSQVSVILLPCSEIALINLARTVNSFGGYRSDRDLLAWLLCLQYVRHFWALVRITEVIHCRAVATLKSALRTRSIKVG